MKTIKSDIEKPRLGIDIKEGYYTNQGVYSAFIPLKTDNKDIKTTKFHPEDK